MGNKANKVSSNKKTCLAYYETENKHRIIMTGLDAAGKTTILYKMKMDTKQIPVIGFNVERTITDKMEIITWDCGGCDKIRGLWEPYYQTCDALIFVIDSNDRNRIDSNMRSSSKQQLFDQFLLHPFMRDVVVLILANKQDLPNAMDIDEIQDRLGMTLDKTQQIHQQLQLLKNETLLALLTQGIISIIESYIPTRYCAPNLSGHKVIPELLRDDTLLTGRWNLGTEDYKIRALICEYLPLWQQVYGSQKKCKIMPCSAKTGQGLSEAFQWLTNQLIN